MSFTQQGLEKLNNLTTKYFQSASNHREMESLKQILQKHNCLEALEDANQKCSICKLIGHNKHSCKEKDV